VLINKLGKTLTRKLSRENRATWKGRSEKSRVTSWPPHRAAISAGRREDKRASAEMNLNMAYGNGARDALFPLARGTTRVDSTHGFQAAA